MILLDRNNNGRGARACVAGKETERDIKEEEGGAAINTERDMERARGRETHN